jgi:hypothetical protein
MHFRDIHVPADGVSFSAIHGIRGRRISSNQLTDIERTFSFLAISKFIDLESLAPKQMDVTI